MAVVLRTKIAIGFLTMSNESPFFLIKNPLMWSSLGLLYIQQILFLHKNYPTCAPSHMVSSDTDVDIIPYNIERVLLCLEVSFRIHNLFLCRDHIFPFLSLDLPRVKEWQLWCAYIAKTDRVKNTCVNRKHLQEGLKKKMAALIAWAMNQHLHIL